MARESLVVVNTKFPNCRKSNNWKEIWFANINLYWWIMSTISVLTLLQKVLLWFYILYGLDSNAKFSSIWFEDGSNGLHNKSMSLSLLEICCSSSSSSPSNVLQVLQRSLRQNFSKAWASWKLGVQNERGCPLFIVILEDKLHFEYILESM